MTGSKSASCAAAVVEHPKHAGRRIFNSGINLTHLYYGQIAFADFILERELGLLNKIYRGHWRSDSYSEQFEDYAEKPWLAAVETHAIGGGCQLLCVMDRVSPSTAVISICPPARKASFPVAPIFACRAWSAFSSLVRAFSLSVNSRPTHRRGG